MKADYINEWWDTSPDLKEGGKILCPECEEWSNHSRWRETEVHCDTCGGHMAMECPKCEYWFDHVWSDKFITK